MRDPTKNQGPISSAVLTFIGYKQTNKQTDRQAKFIWILWKIKVDLQVVFKMSGSGVGLGVVPGERSFFFSGKSRNVTNVLKKVRIRFVPRERSFFHGSSVYTDIFISYHGSSKFYKNITLMRKKNFTWRKIELVQPSVLGSTYFRLNF